jgi:hypothetical protein
MIDRDSASFLLNPELLGPVRSPASPLPSPGTPPQPTYIKGFKSSSGRTVILYFTYTSGTCPAAQGCNFRGPISTLPGFDQVEVFLCGFMSRTRTAVDRLVRIGAEVNKYNYDTSTGELEVGITGKFATAGSQQFGYTVTFAVILTDSTAARFMTVGHGCRDTALCSVKRLISNAVPPGMHYIGLGTRLVDLGSDSGPVALNTLLAHNDGLTLSGSSVDIEHFFMLRDGHGQKIMFAEWNASTIAFDPSEMDQNDSNLFPQYTILGTTPSGRTDHSGIQAKAKSGGLIKGFLDVLDGFSLFYSQLVPGPEHSIWMIEASATNFRTSLSPQDTAVTDYGMFLGTTFGDTGASQLYQYQMSRALGLLR